MPQQRQSPRTPLHLKPTDSNSIRSAKLESRSPRSPLHERKKGSRVADLESKLSIAQDELEKLKEQLASAEEAKIAALKQLEETKKHCPVSPLKTEALDPVDEEKEKTINIEEEKVDPFSVLNEKDEFFLPAEEDSVNCSTTDIFEVASASSDGEESRLEEKEAEAKETKLVIEEENCKEENEEVESQEITKLRAMLAEKEEQFAIISAKNQVFIKEADQMETKLAEAEEQLNNTKMIAEQLKEKLEIEETEKTSMQAEMKRLRVQTEQWRKAAEAAASVLVAGDGLSESGRSMEKHLRGCDIAMSGGGWSPAMVGGEAAEGNGGAKRRSSGGGIRAFGELWKKKGQQMK